MGVFLLQASMGWWDWAGIALGLIGLLGFLMAVQPFLQMIFGQPQIKLRATSRTHEGNKLLALNVTNLPVTNPLLKFLKIHRNTAESVVIRIDVMNGETNKEEEVAKQRWPSAGTITLPSDLLGQECPIACRLTDGRVLVGNPSEPIEVSVGFYKLTIGLLVGEKFTIDSGSFHFIVCLADIYWHES